MDLDILKLVWNGLLTGIIMLLGWVWNGINKRLDDIDTRHAETIRAAIDSHSKTTETLINSQSKFQDTITTIQVNYVHKDELRAMRAELLTRFDRLEDLVSKRTQQ